MNILIGGLANLVGMSQDDIANITIDGVIDENAFLTLFQDKEAQRIESIIAPIKKSNTDLLGRAKSEALSNKEKEIAAKYGIQKATIDEMIVSIESKVREEASNAANNTGTGEVLTKERILSLPIAQDVIREAIQASEAKYTAKVQEFEDYKTSEETKTHTTTIRQLMRNEYVALNPVLPTDPTKRERAIDLFINNLDTNLFGRDENGVFIKDENGYPKTYGQTAGVKAFQRVQLKDFLQDESPYDFNEVVPVGVAGQNGNGQTATSGAKINTAHIKTRQDAFNAMAKASTKQEKELWYKFIDERGHTLE